MSDMSMANTKWDGTYHIVFISKYRRKVLYGEFRQKLLVIMKRLCRNKGIEIVDVAMCIDYVHMSVRIPSKLSVAEFMGYLKGKNTLMLFDENPELRIGLGGQEDIM